MTLRALNLVAFSDGEPMTALPENAVAVASATSAIREA
jgi:hypothetical protein